MRRRDLIVWAGTALILEPLLAACGGSDQPPSPPPPTVLKLSVEAAANVNPDESGTPEPLKVRILRLANTQMFAQTDFFTLDADPKKALGQELIAYDDLMLSPGTSTTYERTCEPEVRFVGVMGAYFAIDHAQWRALKPVARDTTNALTARFDAAGLTLQEASA
jgi:type VI secretion system protein VasD